jgi:hypothetical protein
MQFPTMSLRIVGLVAILALTGCSAAAPEDSASTDSATPDFSTIVDPTWTVPADLVGDPVVSDGHIASYVVADTGALNIVVWDAATGDELWRDIAVPGSVPSGLRIDAVGVGVNGVPHVTYLSPVADRDDWQRVVVAELASGTQLNLTNDVVWASDRPRACADESDICFTGWIESDPEADLRVFRIDAANGTVLPDTDVVLPANSRQLSERVFSTNARPPEGVEEVGFSADGEIRWQMPYTEIFGAGYSSDAGWNWGERYESDDIIVGMGQFRDSAVADDSVQNLDLSQRKTVGVDTASGDVRWTVDGADTCVASNVPTTLLDDVVPLCRVNSGTRVIDASVDGANPVNTTTDLDVDLIGIDPTSGQIMWTLPLGGSQTNIDSSAGSFALRLSLRPLDVGDDKFLVDALTGETSPLPADATFACTIERDDFEMTWLSSTERTGYNAGRDVVPCSADRVTATDEALSAAAILMGGFKTDEGSYIVGTPTGLASYSIAD